MTTAPLPSPIPRARGSRSAADEIFSRFLDSSLHVPDLTLPPENRHLTVRPRHHDNGVDFGLLLSRDDDAIDELIIWAEEIGAMRINFRGIFEERLQSLVRRFLQVTKGASGAVNENERMISRLNRRSLDWASWFLEDPNFDCFSEEFEYMESKLGIIAKEVLKILSEAANRKLPIEEGQATLSIIFEPKNSSADQNLTSKDSSSSSSSSSPFALRVRLPINTEQSGFCDSSVYVSLGKQLEEWSNGELKSDPRESIVDRPETRIHGSRTSFSFEYEFCLPTEDQNQSCVDPSGVDGRTISLFDQVIICIFITCLVKIFMYIVN